MRYGAWHNFFSFWTIFLPIYPSPPLTTQRIKILKKWKKYPRDSIILHNCIYHKWQSYDIWFLRYELQQTDFFVILGHFLPFYPRNRPKNKISKKKKRKKKAWRYHHFTQVIPKIMIMCYTVPEIWYVTDVIFSFHFGKFFALLPPNSPKNENFKKMKKTTGWSNGLVVKALGSQSRGPMFKTTGWLQGRLSLSSFRGR